MNYFVFETSVKLDSTGMTYYFEYAIDQELSSSDFETMKLVRCIDELANTYDSKDIIFTIDSIKHSIEAVFDDISTNELFYKLSLVQKKLQNACKELYGDKVFIRRSCIGTDSIKIPIYYSKLAQEMEEKE